MVVAWQFLIRFY